ncbi:MAG: hypothetical protein LM550_13410 [Candidatus Contendobacter sp.]|jgi:hypothetical protein|nr:hypothetical protein [Gammaproteobacteria bacterium]MCC8994653.1 hypothetical protein [Candidatus Contendobacter sp.]
MNLRHLVVFVAALIIFMISTSLLTQVFEHSGELIGELLTLYGFGAMVGFSLTAAWLMGEFTDQH